MLNDLEKLAYELRGEPPVVYYYCVEYTSPISGGCRFKWFWTKGNADKFKRAVKEEFGPRTPVKIRRYKANVDRHAQTWAEE